VRVSISKIDGVTAVTVSLNEGMTSIRFALSNRVTVEQIRKVIRSNGFTPKEAEVRVTGVLVSRGDTLTLAVPGADEVYLLQDAPDAEGKLSELRQMGQDTRVVVTGQVPGSSDRPSRAPRTLLIRSYTAGTSGAWGQAAQQDSFATSLLKACAASFKPSERVRYG